MDYDYLMRCVACRLCKMVDFSKYTLTIQEVTHGNKYLRVQLTSKGHSVYTDCSEQVIRSVEPVQLAEQIYEKLEKEIIVESRLGSNNEAR